jgi:hypothetical protein
VVNVIGKPCIWPMGCGSMDSTGLGHVDAIRRMLGTLPYALRHDI